MRAVRLGLYFYSVVRFSSSEFKFYKFRIPILEYSLLIIIIITKHVILYWLVLQLILFKSNTARTYT